MMEWCQRCVEISKRSKALGNTGSCTDCGKYCGSLLTTSSPNCRCNTKPTSTPCQNKTTICDEIQREQQQHQITPPTAPTTSADAHKEESGKKSKEKQSFWQWLLSLVGLGGKKEQTSQEKGVSVKYDTPKSTGKSQKPIETYSPQNTLAEVKEICNEIKKRKPDLYIKSEQSSPPAPAPREDSKTQTSPSPETKRKRKGKGKTSPSSPSREKYLGRPLESTPKKGSTPKKSTPRSGTQSPRREKDSSPKARVETFGGGEQVPTSGEKSPAAAVQRERPPTSPIYSSERYLKSYQTGLCPKDKSCFECSGECSQDSSSPPFGKSKKCKKQPRPDRPSNCTPSASYTMPCTFCPCPVCCPQPCCPPPCCRKPCCSMSSCCCVSELKKDMRKGRGSTSPCGRGAGGSPRTRQRSTSASSKTSKRRRSSSCPSSPRPFPCSCCPPPVPRCPPLKSPASCGATPRASISSGKAKFSCKSLCPPAPVIKPCPPPLCPLIPRIPKSLSPAGCPVGCGPSIMKKSPCSNCSGCPITCMKPCCLPSAFCLPSALNCAPKSAQTCASPPSNKYSTFSPNTCYVKSYSRSKGNDAFCKQLMAKYNVTAPEPLAFCPLPRNFCPPCDYTRKKEVPSFSSKTIPACKPCAPTSCYNSCNNNKPLSYTKNNVYDMLENSCHSSNLISPKTESQGPITFKTSPSHTQPRVEFRLPKRTPVECIKQTGPRSPCKEYMTTNYTSPVKGHNKGDKSMGEHVTEEENVAPADAVKATGSPQKGKGGKPKKRKSAQRPKEEPNEKIQKEEEAQNTSENKTVNDNSAAMAMPSGLLSWRRLREKAMAKKSRSKSTERTKKSRPAGLVRSNRSPVKTITERSGHVVGRYSPGSKSFYPTFLRLSPESKAPKHYGKTSSVPSPRFDNFFLPTSGSMVDKLPVTNMNAVGRPSSNQPIVTTKSPFNEITSIYNKYRATPEPNNASNPPKSFGTSFQYPRRKRCTSLTLYDKPTRTGSVFTSCERNVEENIANRPKNFKPFEMKYTSTVESESLTMLPKVESITSLVEKYDKIDISESDVMAQSNCTVFDYISVESSSAITASIKEDPSLSVIEELTNEDSSGTEATVSPKEPADDSHTTAPTGSKADQEESDSEEMKKGMPKYEHAHGDIHDHREETKRKRPVSVNKNVDVTSSISESIGDNLRAPFRNTKLEIFAQKIGLRDGLYMSTIGESSVDPDEYGFMGESAVDPASSFFKTESRNKPFLRSMPEMNHSNNNNPGEECKLKVDTADGAAATGQLISEQTPLAAEPTSGPIRSSGPTRPSGPTAVPITAETEADESDKIDIGCQGADESAIARAVEGRVKIHLPSVELLQRSNGLNKKVEMTRSGETAVDLSNNEQSQPMIDKVEVGGQGEGVHRKPRDASDEESGDPNAEESKEDNKPKVSALDQLLSNSGVRWTKVNEATKADIKLLQLGKAAYSRKRQVDSGNTSGDKSGAAAAANPSLDTQPYLNFLKPEEIESSELCVSDASSDQLKSFGTPV